MSTRPARRPSRAELRRAATRFVRYVNRAGPLLLPALGRCWVWTGGRKGRGYGAFNLRHDLSVSAHRMAWMLRHGPIPPRMLVLHRCDNPACVRPSHLRLGSQADNMAQMVARGRSSAGSARPRAKLSESKAARIRARYARGGISQRQLAARYGVCQSVISEIIAGKAWRRAAA